MSENSKPHLFVKNVHTSQSFTTPPSGGSGDANLPLRQRDTHGNALLHSLSQIWEEYSQEVTFRADRGLPVKDGEYLTFKSAENNSLKIESLDSSGAILLNVNTDKNTNQQIATVYIPENQKDKLSKKVEKYLNGEKNGKPHNQDLVEKIETIKRTSVENLWSSTIESLPQAEAVWCEIWLATEGINLEAIILHLKQVCTLFGVEVLNGILEFPQRSILVVKANYDQLSELISSLGLIAENT